MPSQMSQKEQQSLIRQLQRDWDTVYNPYWTNLEKFNRKEGEYNAEVRALEALPRPRNNQDYDAINKGRSALSTREGLWSHHLRLLRCGDFANIRIDKNAKNRVERKLRDMHHAAREVNRHVATVRSTYTRLIENAYVLLVLPLLMFHRRFIPLCASFRL